MKSILENRPALRAELGKVAEVAGYLWQKGWAGRNMGFVPEGMTDKAMDDIRRAFSLPDKRAK